MIEGQFNRTDSAFADVGQKIKFLQLSEDPHPERYIPQVVPWIYESGSYHFDRLFGDRDCALSALSLWAKRTPSEFSIRRATVAVFEGICSGVIFDIAGNELQLCHRADTLALLKETKTEARKSLLERLAVLRDLTPPVLATDYYLRAIGVEPCCRGKGVGRRLFQRYLQNGMERGFRQFRLDVLAENHTAIRLYASLGFKQMHEVVVPRTGWKICSMALNTI